MNKKHVTAIISAFAIAISGCTDNKPDPVDAPIVVTPTETSKPVTEETVPDIALPEEEENENDHAYAEWIHTVLLMAPHSEVDGLFVHMDPESLEYLSSIVGERIELTAEDVNKNLFYRYIAFTLGVSSFSELSDKIESPRASGKIFFTFTYSFDDPRRRIKLEFEGTKTILK